MKFASLGSGSRGNALVISDADTHVLIDCGLSYKVLTAALNNRGLNASDLDAIFITHEHSDHIKGLGSLLRHCEAQVFMSHGTAIASDWIGYEGLNIVCDNQNIEFGPFLIQPIIVPHDAREPCQYVVRAGQMQASTNTENIKKPKCLGILTDLGSCSHHILRSYAECDALILECNHDVEMLKSGNYPLFLKQRVLGDWGHLSNDQACEILSQIETQKLQWLVLAHISQKNNCEGIALSTIQTVFPGDSRTVIADQDTGFDWLTIQ